MDYRYGIDTKKTNIDNELTTLFYYLFPKANMSDSNVWFIGQLGDQIQNISYHPFMNKEDFIVGTEDSMVNGSLVHNGIDNINPVNLDYDRLHIDRLVGNVETKLYRITGLNEVDKVIGEYDIQTVYNQAYNNKVESKLLLYPFKYYMLTDYINPPLIIKPQLMESVNGKWQFKVKYCVTNTTKYNLYPFKYKADVYGNLEGIINNNPMLYPVTSNAYNSWIMSNGQSFDTNNKLALAENDLSLQATKSNNIITNGIGMITSAIALIGGIASAVATGGASIPVIASIGGGVAGLAGTGANMANKQKSYNNQHTLKEQQIEESALARTTDLVNTPRALKTMGNDCTFNMFNGNRRIDLIEFTITPQRKARINNYLKKYGYKVNDYTTPNYKTRKYYNYVKTIDCDIDSANIPNEDLLGLQNIFNSGVTFWHVDNGAKIKDYSVDNIEV